MMVTEMRKLIEIFPNLAKIRIIKRLSELRDFHVEEIHITIPPDIVIKRRRTANKSRSSSEY